MRRRARDVRLEVQTQGLGVAGVEERGAVYEGVEAEGGERRRVDDVVGEEVGADAEGERRGAEDVQGGH